MPWFPDFVGALELARRQVRAEGRVDPVGQYVAALTDGKVRDLETVWPGEVVVDDPHAGTVRGHRQLRQFVPRSRAALAARDARIDRVAAISGRGRAVVELLVHLGGDGPDVEWPVAVVAESTDDRSAVFRTYGSQWQVDGRRHVRSPILEPRAERVGDVVDRCQSALQAGDVDAAVGAFAADGYYRGPLGPTACSRAPVSCGRSSPPASQSASAAVTSSRRASASSAGSTSTRTPCS